ncbi:MAG TPA: DUF2834 domain-containing protein [Anaerolineae bacterium]|nr:DUF2834 domain-containing protein [Anaerolineae bacterium]
MKRITIIGTLILFSILTLIALFTDGLSGFPTAITYSYASLQIYIDLVIAIIIINVWLWHDARQNNHNPWPWLIASLIVGSFSPLIYLLLHHTKK